MNIAISYMAKTQGREKSLKAAGNIMKILHTFSGVEGHGALSKQCSQGRSFLRLCEWFEQLQSIRKAYEKGAFTSFEQVMAILRWMCEAAFAMIDNINLFAKFGFIQLDVTQLTLKGTWALFWVYSNAVTIDLYRLTNWLSSEAPDGRAIRKILYDLVRHTCDLLCQINNTKLLPLNFSALILGILGGTSAVMACWNIWEESKPKESKAKTS